MKRRRTCWWSVLRLAASTTAFLVCLIAALPAWGWGVGHNGLQRAIIERLPQSFRAHLSEQTIRTSIQSWSHYPDSFETFDAEAALIGPDALATLKRYGLQRRYDLHHDRGRAVTFILLVDALRAERYDAALFWLTSLGHSTGDMAACNHDPLLHVATYDWPHVGATLPGGVPAKKIAGSLDLAYALAQPEGPAAFDAAIDSTRMADDGRDPQAELLDVMMYGHEGAKYCSARGVPILACAAAWLGHRDEAARADLCRKVAELGAWAAVRVLRDFEVAQRMAGHGTRIEWPEELSTAYSDRVNKWITERSLQKEAIFAPVLRPLSPTKDRAVGVVLEPTWRMNEGMLGFNSRVIAASICRTLAASGKTYATLDIRDLARDGLPDPKQVPVVVVPAARFANYHWMKTADVDRHFRQYMDAGGRTLWIGGTSLPPPTALADIRGAMTKPDKLKWPLPAERLLHCRVCLLGTEPSQSWPITRSPDTPAGWQRPYAPWSFPSLQDTALVPLLELADGDSQHTVGVLWRQHDRACAAFLPTYALHPYLLDRPDVLATPAEPHLDRAGTAILLDVLDRLVK